MSPFFVEVVRSFSAVHLNCPRASFFFSRSRHRIWLEQSTDENLEPFQAGLASVHRRLPPVFRIRLSPERNKKEKKVLAAGAKTLSPVSLQEQHTVIFLLERVLVSWSLAIDEHGRHKNLRCLSRQSVIPYVQWRTELYCSSLYAWACLFISLCEEVSTRSFYSSRSDSYNETRGPTGGPEVVETLYNI
jgi:hypothetical protein